MIITVIWHWTFHDYHSDLALDIPFLTFPVLKDAGNFWRCQWRVAQSEKWRVSAFDTFDDVVCHGLCLLST